MKMLFFLFQQEKEGFKLSEFILPEVARKINWDGSSPTGNSLPILKPPPEACLTVQQVEAGCNLPDYSIAQPAEKENETAKEPMAASKPAGQKVVLREKDTNTLLQPSDKDYLRKFMDREFPLGKVKPCLFLHLSPPLLLSGVL